MPKPLPDADVQPLREAAKSKARQARQREEARIAAGEPRDSDANFPRSVNTTGGGLRLAPNFYVT